MNLADLFNLHGLSAEELCAAQIELCERGLLTCTFGKPGSAEARYALAWLPLDQPERFSQRIQKRHMKNMRQLGFEDHS